MQDRQRWNERYHVERTYRVNAQLIKYAQLLRPGRALDLAGGTGQNARFLADRGWSVVIADVSDVGLARASGIRVLAASPALPFAPACFDTVLSLNFLDITLDARYWLKPGGTLMVATFTPGDEKYNPGFPAVYRLDPSRIPVLFAGFRTLHWDEDDDGTRVYGTFIGVNA